MGSWSLLLKCAVSPSLLPFLCEDSICTSFYWVLHLICSLRFLVSHYKCPFDLSRMTPGESYNEWYQYYCSNIYLFKCQEKRQEKCSTFQVSRISDKKNAPHLKRQEKLLHFKCQEKRQEKCSTFQVSREATRKMRHIWSVKKSAKKVAWEFFIIWNLPVKKYWKKN